MNHEHTAQCHHIDEQIIALKDELTTNYGEIRSDVMALKKTIYGDDRHDEMGMKEKVDEMHTIITQLKGLKWILGGVILISTTLIAIKGLIWK